MQLVLSQNTSLPRRINWFLRDNYKSLFCISNVQGYIFGLNLWEEYSDKHADVIW